MRDTFFKEQLSFTSKYWPFKDYGEYYIKVKKDFSELIVEYPFSEICIIPTVEPSPLELDIVAANRKLIDDMNAVKEDFDGKYSRKLKVVVPYNYIKNGCHVYGGAWIDSKRIRPSDQHYYKNYSKNGMPMLCVGVPESFQSLNNVILENVRTADVMLNAYDLLLSGMTETLQLKAYSHGDVGKEQYKRDKRKYTSSGRVL